MQAGGLLAGRDPGEGESMTEAEIEALNKVPVSGQGQEMRRYLVRRGKKMLHKLYERMYALMKETRSK